MTGELAEKISAVFVHHMLHRNDVEKNALLLQYVWVMLVLVMRVTVLHQAVCDVVDF